MATRPKSVALKRRAGRMPVRAKPRDTRWYADMGDLLKLGDANPLGGLLQECGISIAHGDPGTFKTSLALTIGSCIAYGMPIIPGGPRCKRGLFLHVAFEDIRGFKGRRLAWLRYHGLPSQGLTVDAVKLIDPYGSTEGLPGLDFDLLDTVKVDKFIEHAKALAKEARLPVRLIVIDVLRDAVGGVLSVKTFREAGNNLRRMAAALNTHIMVLHHNTVASQRMLGPGSLTSIAQQRFLLTRAGNAATCHLSVMKNRDGRTGMTFTIRAHEMVMGIQKGKRPITALALEFEGVTMDLLESNYDKVLGLCSFFEPDTSLSEAQVLKQSGMSIDGHGGMQRTLLRKWIPPIPNSITVHAGGTDFRMFFREKNRSRWIYFCQARDPASAREDMLMERAGRKGPKHEPEVARRKRAGRG